MKEKKDCKECGKPLKDWQIKQGYDLCLDCYNSSRRGTSHKAEENSKGAKDGETKKDLDEEDERLES